MSVHINLSDHHVNNKVEITTLAKMFDREILTNLMKQSSIIEIFPVSILEFNKRI